MIKHGIMSINDETMIPKNACHTINTLMVKSFTMKKVLHLQQIFKALAF